MQKIVINADFGGFCLSDLANARLKELGFRTESEYDYSNYRRNPVLIRVIEELGTEKASGEYANLKIIEIPDDVTEWYISDYDGLEEIHETHRIWN